MSIRRAGLHRGRRNLTRPGSGSAPFGLPYYLGPVAGRCRQSSSKGSAGQVFMCRTFHFARTDITTIQVAWPNYFGTAETGTGGALTVTASVEYPAGTFNQLLFSGLPAGVAADGATLMSDSLTLAIPNGAKFFVRFLLTPVVGICYYNGPAPLYTAGGDAVHFPGTDQTMGGTVVDSGIGIGVYPCAILGQTNKKTLALMGDSRVHGLLDTADATGDVGELERPLAPNYGSINIGVSGDTANNFNLGGNSTNRRALAAYASHRVGNWGINDLVGGASATTLESNISGIRNSAPFTGKPFYLVTVAPNTSGAWTLANGSDQTPAANTAQRLLYNTWVRNNVLGVDGFFDTVGPSKLTADENRWNADGTAAKYTGDGLHETAFANQQYVFTGP